jgi:lipopolysaccharide export system permease protein
MSLVRRHDLYVGKAFVATLVAALVILSTMVIVYDVAERLDKLSKAAANIRLAKESGRVAKDSASAQGLLVEYYATLLPFLWMKLLPTASLLAAGLTITWFARQNELVPLVTSGIPSRRVLVPIFVVAGVVVLAMSVARETIVPSLSRRHDDLHRLFSDPDRNPDQIHDIAHFDDADGGRLSMATFVLSTKRIESAYLLFRRDPSAGGSTVVRRYPVLDWDPQAKRWTAPRGGERRVLEPVETGADVSPISPAEPVPLRADPRLLELRIRQGLSMGLASREIRELAAAAPADAERFELLLNQQWAQPFGTIVMLLLGLPFAFRLGRRRPVFRAFGATLGLVALYFFSDSVTTDMGARGALSPLVAAWGAHVVFGALGIALVSGIET